MPKSKPTIPAAQVTELAKVLRRRTIAEARTRLASEFARQGRPKDEGAFSGGLGVIHFASGS